MQRNLSPRQKNILEFIVDFISKEHFPPTIRDIQSGCGVSSTSVVNYNLQILQREGYLNRLAGGARGIEVTDRAYDTLGLNVGESNSQPVSSVEHHYSRIPIIASIAAGPPISTPHPDAMSDPNIETIEIPPSMTEGKKDVYGLRVKGTSMIDAFVADGDLVLLEPVANPVNGDMVAALLKDDEEVTLKRFYLEGGTVRLQPENREMEPISVAADRVAVQGRVVGVVRTI